MICLAFCAPGSLHFIPLAEYISASQGRSDRPWRSHRSVRSRAWRCLCRPAGQSRPERIRRTGLPQCRSQGRTPAVFRHQEPPVCRRQQAQRRLPVCGFSQPQRPPARQQRPAGNQRHRPGSTGAAGRRICPGQQRHHDPPDHEHAGAHRTGAACLSLVCLTPPVVWPAAQMPESPRAPRASAERAGRGRLRKSRVPEN